jgi:methylated-DNA-protein-cysteine methyltransferase related protein
MEAALAVYGFVKTVPAGSVVSYGQVADMCDAPVTARIVGQLMASCPDDVPWQRVVGADGRLPIARRGAEPAAMQRRLLEREGIGFLPDGRVDMNRYRWMPEEPGGLFADGN